MSWKVEVIADDSGQWCGNAVRFETREEARFAAEDLALRWILVRDYRETESDDPANYAIVEGVKVYIGAAG